jgi:hypothetical protein
VAHHLVRLRDERIGLRLVACFVGVGLVARVLSPDCGAPGASDDSAVTTAGKVSYSTSISSAASFAWLKVSAMMNATGSPT